MTLLLGKGMRVGDVYLGCVAKVISGMQGVLVDVTGQGPPYCLLQKGVDEPALAWCLQDPPYEGVDGEGEEIEHREDGELQRRWSGELVEGVDYSVEQSTDEGERGPGGEDAGEGVSSTSTSGGGVGGETRDSSSSGWGDGGEGVTSTSRRVGEGGGEGGVTSTSRSGGGVTSMSGTGGGYGGVYGGGKLGFIDHKGIKQRYDDGRNDGGSGGGGAECGEADRGGRRPYPTGPSGDHLGWEPFTEHVGKVKAARAESGETGPEGSSSVVEHWRGSAYRPHCLLTVCLCTRRIPLHGLPRCLPSYEPHF